MEEELARAKELAQLIAENASDIVVRLTPEGVFEWVSGATVDLLGWRPEELLGRNKLALRHPEDLAAGSDLLRPLLDGSVVTETDRILRADGTYRWMNRRYRAILDEDGTALYLIGSWRDAQAEMDVRQALEDREREARGLAARYEAARDEALVANMAKTEFLSSVSHELRTPLNAVLGFAQVLGMGALDADQREAVAHIRAGGRHLLDLINELLDISRIESGQLTLSLESVAVADAVSETLDMVATLAEGLGVTVARDGPGQCRTFVRADRQRTIQVLLNLISNAVKYNRPGGSVTVSCTPDQDDSVLISVTDTGPGLDADQLARLFRAFDRLGAENSTVEGTGIGLALSHGLAVAMGGGITVSSRVGEGSVFTLTLPRAATPTTPPTSASAPVAVSGTRPRRLLYIEDNPANARLMERIVGLRAHVVLSVASTGQEGLRLARAIRPDVVLLDLHLPDMTGHEVLEELRDDPFTRDLTVVVLTADATTVRRRRSVELGASGFLTKPIEVADVLEWIDGTGTPGGMT